MSDTVVPSLELWKSGQDLEPARHTVTHAGLFTYSAVTWNPHRIHYDLEYARSLGHPDLLVPGALLADWMIQVIRANFADSVVLRTFGYRALSPTIASAEIVAGGVVSEVRDAPGGLELTVNTWVRADGDLTMEGVVALQEARGAIGPAVFA